MADQDDQEGKETKPKKVFGRPFLKGALNPRNLHPERSGIQAGSRHKSTILREAVLNTFDKVGGEQYLEKVAKSKKEKHLFFAMLAKAMPTEITGAGGGPIELHVLHIAKVGIERLSDDRLALLQELLTEIGVNDVVLAANDDPAQLALPAPDAAPADAQQ